MQQAKVTEVSSSIAIAAAKFSFEEKIPMADCITYITAKVNDAMVWTQDTDLKDLDGVKYFRKS